CRFRSKAGTYAWFWLRALPMKNEAGNVIKWFGTCTNIDEHKRVEEEREIIYRREQAAREEAEAANRMKDEFLATLSHELRTPLNAMLGWTQLLLTKEFKPETRDRALETIHRNTKSLAQLIEDVLDVSRIIRGKLHLNVRPIELAPVIEAAIETVQPAATAKNITLETFIPPSSGNLVSGDFNRLQQVVWNLLSNAVKFTPKGGRVAVKLEIVDSSIAIRVTDTGQGIAPEFLPYVFERFRQEDSSISRSFGGLGLGLAIVRHLVELHGGNVYADSPGVGQGATFTVELPLRAACRISPNGTSSTTTEDSVEEAFDSSLRLDGLKILVVDDEADARELISTILEDKGAKVKAVATAAEALEVVQEGFPNILISDIGMPIEDGYSLIAQVRALEASKGGSIPAVALTAYARAEDRLQALSAGYQLHIPKPVDPDQLTQLVANLASKKYQMVK
ncbi:MAG: ATP-binding protein, partial [Chroococcales cyanobacterium]